MALEDKIDKLTAAIEAQTALLKGLKEGGAAASTAAKTTTAPKTTTKATGPTLDTIKKRFGDYLGTKDKALRTARIEEIGAMMNHFGVDRATLLPEDNWVEALGYLDLLEKGETPEYANEGDGGSLV